jgi:hypothetical protein
MDIDEPATVMLYETICEDAHEPGQHDEIGTIAVDHLRECGVKRGAVGIVAMGHHSGSDAVFFGDSQTTGIGLVADDRNDLTGQLGFQQRLHVAATTGDENDDLFH